MSTSSAQLLIRKMYAEVNPNLYFLMYALATQMLSVNIFSSVLTMLDASCATAL